MYYSIYTNDELKKTYSIVENLLYTQQIIKRHSSNNKDIRELAFNNINLSNTEKILDLGCGYGFFIETLKGRLHRNADITGIDLVNNNRYAYLETVASINYTGTFMDEDVSCIKQFPSESYDLILSSYSLYFFPRLINDVARLLKNNGLFIVITHSEKSLQEIILILIQCYNLHNVARTLNNDYFAIKKLFSEFSKENGRMLLLESFSLVEFIDYSNILNFTDKNIDDCFKYIFYKKDLFFKELLDATIVKTSMIYDCITNKIKDQLHESHHIGITKDDAIFRCFKV